ncbi:apolipoprotein N-acyltransferase [Chitinasiproducens palmae]|uniref:Apolipoprotein N-acyltransferase n=1 Tax=Chitinasiproducens palmae TaxID=1770053 RepID=A0A1H2PN55_9BURK|nr:apolipoprotein N-acyltransferase [Chitinasiproducens palmae]SDV48095.1 apolipoprotein N-acyltransferase [Chitinasiproducens palmae]
MLGSLCALLLGVVQTAGFAPTPYGGWLQLAVMALFYALLHGGSRAAARPVRRAALLGVAFGLGNFVSGVYWLYISMHDFGAMAAPLAAATLVLFCFYLSWYPGLAGAVWAWLSVRRAAAAARRRRVPAPLVFAACWSLGEWLRGMVFTGFPWLSIGYSHVDTPLAGFAGWLGVYGVGFAAALVASALASAFVDGGAAVVAVPAPDPASFALRRSAADPAASDPAASERAASDLATASSAVDGMPRGGPARRVRLAGLVTAVLVLLAGLLAGVPRFVAPDGAPLAVRLLQGNIAQDMKFGEAGVAHAIDLYRELLTARPADLIVTPETAYPILATQIPAADVATLQAFAQRSGSALLFGAVGVDFDPQGRPIAYTNAMFGISPSGGPVYRYVKHHLVPFGEFVPWGFRWLVDAMQIPLGELARGGLGQPPFHVKGRPVAVDICYEDIFGEEIAATLRRQEQPAGLLVNATNLAWFGNTIALDQHLQIARMRTLETGRPMVRATNTGVTAAIDAEGHVLARLPVFTVGALDTRVQATKGLTPYARIGNAGVLALAAVVLAAAAFSRRKQRRPE